MTTYTHEEVKAIVKQVLSLYAVHPGEDELQGTLRPLLAQYGMVYNEGEQKMRYYVKETIGETTLEVGFQTLEELKDYLRVRCFLPKLKQDENGDVEEPTPLADKLAAKIAAEPMRDGGTVSGFYSEAKVLDVVTKVLDILGHDTADWVKQFVAKELRKH